MTENFIKKLNSIDKNIKFTFENENNRSLNYLDVKITRTEDNLFKTTVYRKIGSSREIINARCKIPYNYKIASLRSYINRALIVCSNQKLIDEEIKTIEEIAINNGYSKKLVQ